MGISLVFFAFIAHVYVYGAGTSRSFDERDYDVIERMCCQMELGAIKHLKFKCLATPVFTFSDAQVYGCLLVVQNTEFWQEMAKVMRASIHSEFVCSRKLEGLLTDILPKTRIHPLGTMNQPSVLQLQHLFPGYMAVRWQIERFDQIVDGCCVRGSFALCPEVDGVYALSFVPRCAESSEKDCQLLQRVSDLERHVKAIRDDQETLRSEQVICRKMLESLCKHLCSSKDSDKEIENV